MAKSKKTDLRAFSKRMDKQAKGIPINATKIQKRAFLAVDAAVVSATPVDTGRARSNWLPSVGLPAGGKRVAFTPGTKGSTGQANTEAAIAAAVAITAGFKGGASLFVTNNLDYIRDLNAGKSTQAPNGLFVEMAILAAKSIVKDGAGIKLLGKVTSNPIPSES